MGIFSAKLPKPADSAGLRQLRAAGRDNGWLLGMDPEFNKDTQEWNTFFQKDTMRFFIAYSKNGVVLHMLLSKGKPDNWVDLKETRVVSEGVKILKNPTRFA